MSSSQVNDIEKTGLTLPGQEREEPAGSWITVIARSHVQTASLVLQTVLMSISVSKLTQEKLSSSERFDASILFERKLLKL